MEGKKRAPQPPWPLCALFVQQGRENLIPRFLSDDFLAEQRGGLGGVGGCMLAGKKKLGRGLALKSLSF